MDVKEEIKEEPAILTQIKSEYEEIAHFHSETVFASPHFINESANNNEVSWNGKHNEIEIKEEPSWCQSSDIKQETELFSAALQKEVKELEESQLNTDPNVAAKAGTTKGKKRKAASKDSSEILHFLQIASSVLQSLNVKKDEHDEFGEFVASRLRALSKRHLQEELRKKIMLSIAEVQEKDSK